MAKGFSFNGEFKLTPEMKKAYDDDGFLVVKDLFDKEELDQVMKTLTNPDGMLNHSYTTYEADGTNIVRAMWKNAGNDVTGIISRSEKVVNTCEELLGGEVFHYHSKCILKNPLEGGRHVWHQDYGYWYKHNLFPDLITVWIPLDKATRQNSCLQILQGSHKCGRIEHMPGGASMQTQCNLGRVEALKKKCPHIYCEMDQGDALFLHCNTIHKSAPNDSDMRRLALVCCYNKASNDSFIPHHHANYTKLEKVPDSAIKECRNYTDFSGKGFRNPPAKERGQAALTSGIDTLHCMKSEK